MITCAVMVAQVVLFCLTESLERFGSRLCLVMVGFSFCLTKSLETFGGRLRLFIYSRFSQLSIYR